MKRLVKNGKIILDGTLPLYEKEKLVNAKLEAIEDIEEELGIDLVTFFKYLSAKEVFFINDFNEIQKAVVRSIDKKGLIVFEEAFSWGECDFALYFSEYGKTWALTREELE